MIYGFSPAALKSNAAPLSAEFEPQFSQDFLGNFISVPTKEDVLARAKITEEKRVDPFVQPLVQSKSLTLCHLNLYTGGPKTLGVEKKVIIKEEGQSSALTFFKAAFSRSSKLSKPVEDKVLNALNKMSAGLDKTYRSDINNENGLKPESRQRDFNVYKDAQHLIREAHDAYLREKNQTQQGPTASYMGGYIQSRLNSNSVAANNEGIAVKTFTQAWDDLQTFVNQIELEHEPEEHKAKISAFTLAYKISATLGKSEIVTIGLAIVQFFVEMDTFRDIRNITYENAFRKTVKQNLKSALEVNMSGIGGIPAAQFDYAAGQIHGSVDRVNHNLNDKTDAILNKLETIEATQRKHEENQRKLEAKFNSAARNLGLHSNDSTSSLNSDTTVVGSPPKSPPREEIEELKKENAALHKKVDALESGQQQILALLLAQQANANSANAVTRNA